jgi:AAA domain
MSTIPEADTPPEPLAHPLVRPEPSTLARKWGIYTPGELRQRCKASASVPYLIADLIPAQSISLVVGDSGIGKSPLLYQAALCVAAGIPFLGHQTTSGRVLYLDFENGLSQVDELMRFLARHLELSGVPENLLLWNYNNAPPTWKPEHLAAMVADARPTWVILDSLTAYVPEIEEKASVATREFQGLRKIMRENQTAISGVHHLRKPSNKPDEAAPPLEENPHGWFLQARGSRALVNGSDVRIGIDRPSTNVGISSREIALVLGGFGRVRGNLPTTFISRVLDEDDEPIGYEKLTGASLLFNPEQEQAYMKLPTSVRFKDAQRIYGKGPQATVGWLKKCIGIGIMRKDGPEYRKVEVAE